MSDEAQETYAEQQTETWYGVWPWHDQPRPVEVVRHDDEHVWIEEQGAEKSYRRSGSVQFFPAEDEARAAIRQRIHAKIAHLETRLDTARRQLEALRDE